MLKSQGYCLFFMLALFEGLHSVKGNISKRACLGESIKIFQNILFNSKDIVVSIYKNGDNTIILGMWHVQDAVPSIKNGQSDRVLLDKNGNIWIFNLHVSDEAKYTIKIDIGNNSTKHEVPLYVMGVSAPSVGPSVNDCSDPNKKPVPRTGTLNNDLNETELDNISVGDASERLIPQSVSESSNPKKSCGASDSLTPQIVAGSSNPKRSLDPPFSEEERCEPVGKHPVQGTILKSTGTNRKNITTLVSGNHDKENLGQQKHVS